MGIAVSKKYKLIFWGAVLVGLLFGVTFKLISTPASRAKPMRLNEIVASNGTTLTDEDGEASDWIELFNPNPYPVNLATFALSDEPDQPQKWPLPDLSLPADHYLIIFASGKNRTAPPHLHTNFKLSKSGDFLGLYSILDRQFVDTLQPVPQFRDIAYGRFGDGSAVGYLEPPTPGAGNDSSQVWTDVVQPVQASVGRGFYESPFELALSSDTPGAVIRYTLDGSEPDQTNGKLYAEPLQIEGTSIVRAAAFKPNHLPSRMTTYSYLFLDEVLAQSPNPPGFPNTWGRHISDFGGYSVGAPVLADYAMDRDIVRDTRFAPLMKDALTAIPSLSIVTDIHNFDIYASPRKRGREWERPASVELIDPRGRQPGFQVNAGLRIHGGESRWEYIPKHSFRLLFRGEYGVTRLEYPLFLNSPVAEFDRLVLRGGVSGYAGKPFTDHKGTTYTRDEWLRKSQIEMSGVGSHGRFVHLYLNGLYWGLYNLVERIDESFMASHLGGRESNWQIIGSGESARGVSRRFDTLLQLIEEDNVAEPQRYTRIKTFLNVPQFIDYVLLNWYAGNRDWPGNNWTAGVREPAGRVNYFAWDGENTWLYETKLYLGQPDESIESNTVKYLFEALIENSDFKMALADRAYKHFFNDGPLTDTNAQARWLAINDEIKLAILGESARWGDVRFDTPITRDDWHRAVDNVSRQMEGNAEQLIQLLREAGYYPQIDPPQFNQLGGWVDIGFRLTLSPPPNGEAGTIYYTLDGSDPRLPGVGEVSSGAMIYRHPMVLKNNTQIKARLWQNGEWSALAEANFTVAEQDHPLRITEIMYNPSGGSDYEFIELKNIGDAEVELANISIEGLNFTFPPGAPPLPAGQTLILVSNRPAFSQRYPDVAIGGVFGGQLSNKGEELVLKDAAGTPLISVNYDDNNGWPVSPDGRGDSLVLVNLDGDPNNPKNWRASTKLHGSPGSDEPESPFDLP